MLVAVIMLLLTLIVALIGYNTTKPTSKKLQSPSPIQSNSPIYFPRPIYPFPRLAYPIRQYPPPRRLPIIKY